MTCRFASALTRLSPSFRRALVNSYRCPRRSMRVLPVDEGTASWIPAGSISSTQVTGSHIFVCSIGTMPRAPHCGAHAQSLEIVAGDDLAESHARLLPGFHCCKRGLKRAMSTKAWVCALKSR